MFKLQIFLTIIVIVNASDLNTFNGDWTIVEFWPKHSNAERKCYTFNIKGTKDVTKCKGGDVSLLHMEFEREDLPAIVVDTLEEVTDAVDVVCEDYQTHYVLRRLDDNYFILEVVESNDHITALLAKRIPSEVELKGFVSNLESLKMMQGSTICTQEMRQDAGWISSNRGKINGLADLLPLKKQTRKQV